MTYELWFLHIQRTPLNDWTWTKKTRKKQSLSTYLFISSTFLGLYTFYINVIYLTLFITKCVAISTIIFNMWRLYYISHRSFRLYPKSPFGKLLLCVYYHCKHLGYSCLLRDLSVCIWNREPSTSSRLFVCAPFLSSIYYTQCVAFVCENVNTCAPECIIVRTHSYISTRAILIYD